MSNGKRKNVWIGNVWSHRGFRNTKHFEVSFEQAIQLVRDHIRG